MFKHILPSVTSFVPINSLRYNCVSQLASMMKPLDESESTAPKPTESSFHSQPEYILNLPRKSIQLIIDHITRKQIKTRVRALCALLSNGGCCSLDLLRLERINNFEDEEMELIFDALSQNCAYYRRLRLPYLTGQWSLLCNNLGENSFIDLQYLSLFKIDPPEDLITILSACPNLIGLEVDWILSTDQKMTIICEELRKPVYNQVRQSIRELKLGSYLYVTIIVKLISLFPNLIKLECGSYEKIYDFTKLPTAEKTYVTSTEREEASKILSQLQRLITKPPLTLNCVEKIVSVHPDLQELRLEFEIWSREVEGRNSKTLNAIGNLKCLKHLTLIAYIPIERVSLMMKQIGANLEYLEVLFDDIDLSIIARYCPNLKVLALQCTYELYYNQAVSLDNISDAEQENLKRPFQHLRTLYLDQGLSRSDESLTYILNNALNIEIIQLEGWYGLTDRHLIELMENNPLQNLRVLVDRTIGRGPISKTILNKLTNLLDKLSYIDVKTDLKPIDY